MTDYYAVLGVKPIASTTELRRAFRRLARRFHPEVNPGDRVAETHYREICEAFEVLSRPDERERYDRLGARPEKRVEQPVVRYGFEGFDFSLTGDADADIFPEIFLRPRAPSRSEEPLDGEDLQHTLTMSFEESLRGVRASFQIRRLVACTTCSGWGGIASGDHRACPSCEGRGRTTQTRGHMLFAKPCPDCGGSGTLDRLACPDCRGAGRLPTEETLEIRTPPGVYDGYRLIVPGKGMEGRGGGETGNLEILVHVVPHPFVSRSGDNLYCTVPVTFTEAALGCRIELPTIDGPVKVRVPAGVQSGQKLRLSGRGASRVTEEGRGDLYVTIQVVTPTVHDQRSQELLRELARLNPEDPRKDLTGGLPGTQGVTQ